MKRHVLFKTTPFHTLFIKKKSPERCRFDGTVGLLLPLDAWGRGRGRIFLPCFSPLPLSPKSQKDADTTSPLVCHVMEEGRGRTPWAVRGGCTMAAPPTYPLDRGSRGSSPPPFCFTYKYKGGKLRKKGQKKEKREREKKKRQWREQKTERKKEEKGKQRNREKEERSIIGIERRESREEKEKKKKRDRKKKISTPIFSCLFQFDPWFWISSIKSLNSH